MPVLASTKQICISICHHTNQTNIFYLWFSLHHTINRNKTSKKIGKENIGFLFYLLQHHKKNIKQPCLKLSFFTLYSIEPLNRNNLQTFSISREREITFTFKLKLFQTFTVVHRVTNFIDLFFLHKVQECLKILSFFLLKGFCMLL